MAKMVTLTVPQWVLGVAFAAVLWGGVWLATLTPEPYKAWAVLLAVLWPWWPFAATGIRNWRRRRDDRRRWKAGAALRKQAAQDEARRAEYNETNGPTRP